MVGYLTDNPHILWVAGKNFRYLDNSYTVGDEIDEIKLFPRVEVFVRTRHVIPIVEDADAAFIPFQWRHVVMTRSRADQKLGRATAHPAQVGTYVPGDHTVQVVLDYVDQHPDDQAVQVIYDAERAAGNRSTLLDGLEARGALPPASVAAFTMDHSSGAHTLVVVFTNTSTNTDRPTTYHWDFDDGSTSTLKSPTHSFTTAAVRVVSMTVTNARGSNSVTHTVTVT